LARSVIATVPPARAEVTIDFEAQTVTAPDGTTHRSEIDPGPRERLLKGQDDINLILVYAKAIETFE
jgi:3-isopropylmalate/(R)-2-methylmalate dehydratase small subunit